MTMRTPTCPYCLDEAKLVDAAAIYGHARYGGMYWHCAPCKAWVGTHRGSPKHAPLGRLANAQLRDAKMAAHSAFDHLWQHGGMRRADAYAWLAEQMGIPRGRCHIGWMDVDDCGRVVELCRAELRRRASEQIKERAC